MTTSSKQVALKVIRAGQDSELLFPASEMNDRFWRLDHPNIARLLDGGTTEEGLPYLVMELIDGQPITEYCDRQELSIRSDYSSSCRCARQSNMLTSA